MKIIKNCIQCKACGEVIESNSIYDFVSCSCGKCSVDGGLEYLQRVAETRDIFVEMSQFEEDWFFAGCVKSVPDAPEQEQEAKNLENKIWESKKQNYILQKVLLDGDISSAIFIK